MFLFRFWCLVSQVALCSSHGITPWSDGSFELWPARYYSVLKSKAYKTSALCTSANIPPAHLEHDCSPLPFLETPILACHPPSLPPYITIIITIFSQVYKTQMGRMTEGWNGRIDEFERVNLSLQASLARLREDNEQLRLQVMTRSSLIPI